MRTDLSIWRTLFHGHVSELEAPSVGSPWGVEVDGTLIYPGVCRADYFARQISALADKGSIVAEIGAGYGELAYRLLRRRYDIHYICFDLPEILLRSSYFLSQALPDRSIHLFDGVKPLTRELVERYNIILMPNFMLPHLEHADITVNTRSLSEMSVDTVEEYLRQVSRFTSGYFLHENSNEQIATLGDHFEMPARMFRIPGFRQISAHKSPWSEGGGVLGRYAQYLYVRHE